MYAIKLRNGIYHLLQRSGHDTLCGLRINRGSSYEEDLQRAQELPATEKICKHCTRIKEQDYGG
jgi:hypothetical protein